MPENTLLQSTGFALTPESSHYIGDDKYLCICSVYHQGIGCVIVKVIDGIVVEKGVPVVVTEIYGYGGNPLAVWNGSTVALINCDGRLVGGLGNWVTLSVSGLSVSVLNHGTFSNNMSFVYGCNYNITADAGVICYNYNNEIRFLTFIISGSIITSEYTAPTASSGYVIDDNVRIANCAEYCVLCFSKTTSPSIPQFRIASGLGSSMFAVSDGQTPFLSGAYKHLGLSGDKTGGFLYHCVGLYVSDSSLRYKNPCYVAGKVVSGNIVFGSIYEYEPEATVSKYLVGDIKHMSQGEFVSSFIVGWPDKIFTHKVKVEDSYNISIISTDNIPVDIYGQPYDHLSVSAKSDGNACIFYTDNATKKIFVITTKFFIESPAFWTNLTLHIEGELGFLEKKKTVLVIPGNAGQPYMPAISAIPSRTVFESFTQKECKRVG
jgi:hypothetical protein